MTSDDRKLEERLVDVCPACDSADIYRRMARPGRPEPHDGRYLCLECREEFDEPDHRPPLAPSANNGGDVYEALVDADPDTPLEELARDLGRGT